MRRMNSIFKIAAVGDLMLGDHPVRLGNGVRSTINKMGTDYLFSKVAKYFEDCDIVFGNLEITHSDKGLIHGKIESMEFRGSPLSIPALKKAKFNVVNIANNHCMEHGSECFWETVNLLKKNYICAAGVKADDGHCLPVEIAKNNNRAVLLAYSLHPENYHKEAAVPYTLEDEKSVLEEIKYIKKTSDILIVSLHWGEEFVDYPSPRQVILAHKLVEAGVNVIIGHHPHVMQGIEYYKGALIAYSLGNFVFDMWQKKTRESVIMRMECSIEEIIIKLIPVYINSLFQPEPIEGNAYGKCLKRIDSLSNRIKQEYNDIDTWEKEKIASREQQYANYAGKMVLKHRLENYFYFMAHLYRYNPAIIAQSISRFILRRYEGHKDLTQ